MSLAGLPCAAETAAEAAGERPIHHERIEVTGTNIPRVEAEGALPLQAITREEMIHGGIETAQDLLDRISANQSFGGFTEASGVGMREANNSWGYTAASLRGLGAQRTLVLLNGRRLAPYAYAGGVATDLSAIPVSALERVEVLKDGASAVYGTDAIGGVINFILRRDFRGIEGSANYFATEHGGGDSWRANLAGGFGDYERDGYNGFLLVDHQRQDSLGAAERDFMRTGYRPDLGFDARNRNTFPANISQPGHFGRINPTIPATGGTADSCHPPFSYATPEEPRLCRFDYAAFSDALPQSERTGIVGRFDHRLPSADRWFVEVAYSHGRSRQRITPTPVATDQTPGRVPMILPPSSPYYPADFVRNAGGDPTQPVQLFYRLTELGPRVVELTVDQGRGVTGLQGTRWGWDYQAAISYAANREVPFDVNGGVSAAAFAPLLASGAVNPFGPNTEDVLAQMRATQVSGRESDNRASQYGADFKASRDLVRLPAGPLAVALGLEGRRETLEMHNADFLYTGDVVGGNGALPSIGEASRRVGSAFAEANLPIVRSVEADLAVRADHYSDFGTTVNPKLSLRWMASQRLLLRASYGSGFHAPTLYDLYLPGHIEGTIAHIADPVRCPVTHASEDCDGEFPVVGGGNADLQPEESHQINAGFVLEPSRDVSVTADYYRVRLTHVIAPMTLEAALDTYNVRGSADSQHPGLPGPIEYLRNGQFNVASLDTSGIDVDVRWRVPIPAGRVTISLTGTYVIDYRPDVLQPGEPPGAGRRSLGAGAIARWRHYAAIDWTHGAWGATLAQTFQSGYGEIDFTSCEPGMPPLQQFCPVDRRVGTYSQVDLQARYTGIAKLTVALGVRNLMDRAPPTTNQLSMFQVGIDPTYADARGRMWYAALRYALR